MAISGRRKSEQPILVVRHECLATTPIPLAPFSFSFQKDVNLHVHVHFLLRRRDRTTTTTVLCQPSVKSHHQRLKKKEKKGRTTVLTSSTTSPKRAELSFRFPPPVSSTMRLVSIYLCVCVCVKSCFSLFAQPIFFYLSFSIVFLFLPLLSRPRECA